MKSLFQTLHLQLLYLRFNKQASSFSFRTKTSHSSFHRSTLRYKAEDEEGGEVEHKDLNEINIDEDGDEDEGVWVENE